MRNGEANDKLTMSNGGVERLTGPAGPGGPSGHAASADSAKPSGHAESAGAGGDAAASDTPWFGARRLVGQNRARTLLGRVLESKRISHAWLLTGPQGSGKTAHALAFAECLNGISHFTDLKTGADSRKSSWFSHPDIHFFIPLPRTVSESAETLRKEMSGRLSLLREDPYNRIDFQSLPALGSGSGSKTLRAFYPIDYFRREIRQISRQHPYEGRYTVVILTGIETMGELVANTFLKLLEEPPGNLVFILTANRPDEILPTLLSRCRHIPLSPLTEEEIAHALVRHDGMSPEDARLLARMANGDYSLARSLDPEQIQQDRRETTEFLRLAYSGDAPALLSLIQGWQNRLNLEGQIALCNMLEMKLRDLAIWKETGEESLLFHSEEKEMIRRFCDSLPDARIPEMITHLRQLREPLRQNVQFKLIFTALALRFGYLMRGEEPVVPDRENWRHLPALHPTS